jgi:hypothetical protein
MALRSIARTVVARGARQLYPATPALTSVNTKRIGSDYPRGSVGAPNVTAFLVVNEELVTKALILLGASALSIALLSSLGLPAMLGYLFAGILVGPLGLDLVAASEGARFLAELGLILLMFRVGLEFSWAEILAARRAVFVTGSSMSSAHASKTGLRSSDPMPWRLRSLAHCPARFPVNSSADSSAGLLVDFLAGHPVLPSRAEHQCGAFAVAGRSWAQ